MHIESGKTEYAVSAKQRSVATGMERATEHDARLDWCNCEREPRQVLIQ